MRNNWPEALPTVTENDSDALRPMQNKPNLVTPVVKDPRIDYELDWNKTRELLIAVMYALGIGPAPTLLFEAGAIDPGTMADFLVTDPADSIFPRLAAAEAAIAGAPGVSGLNYQGTWDASLNVPALSNGGGGGSKGHYYRVATAGSTPIDGVSSWKVGDWITNEGALWTKVDNNRDTAAEAKAKYESNPDTNAYTDAEKTKLAGISGTNTGDEVQATEATAGIAEIATQAEADAGTDDQRIMTPLKLANYQKFRSDRVLVKSVSDLPLPVGGVITLEEKIYEFQGVVDIGVNKLQLPNGSCMLRGQNGLTDGVLTDVAASLLNGHASGSNLVVRDLLLQNDNVGGDLFDIQNTGVETVDVYGALFNASASVGTVDGCDLFVIERTFYRNMATGVTVTNIGTFAFVDNSMDDTNSGTYLDIPSGNFDAVFIERNYAKVTAPDVAFDVDNGTAVIVNGIFNGNVTTGTGTYVQGFNENSLNWEFEANVGAGASERVGSMLMEGNATDTVINTVNVWEKIDGTTVAGAALARFTHIASNRLRYDDADDREVIVNVSLSVSVVGGGTKTLEFAVFLTGAKVSNASAVVEVSAANAMVSLNVPVAIVQNDYLEIYVRNTTDAADVLVPNMQVVIK